MSNKMRNKKVRERIKGCIHTALDAVEPSCSLLMDAVLVESEKACCWVSMCAAACHKSTHKCDTAQ